MLLEFPLFLLTSLYARLVLQFGLKRIYVTTNCVLNHYDPGLAGMINPGLFCYYIWVSVMSKMNFANMKNQEYEFKLQCFSETNNTCIA